MSVRLKDKSWERIASRPEKVSRERSTDDKIIDNYPDYITDDDLLEMLLSATRGEADDKLVATGLIKRFGSFALVLASSRADLRSYSGLNEPSISAIKIIELAAARMIRAEVIDQPVINNIDRLIDYLTAMLARKRTEELRVLFLDGKSRLLTDESMAKGTIDHIPVYPREIVKRALEVQATAFILVHNHPTGDPIPSPDDIDMTNRIRDAANVVSIQLYDHIIIGNGAFTSFRGLGWL